MNLLPEPARGVRVRAHGSVMWRRFRPWPTRPWMRRVPPLWHGIPYFRWKYYAVEIIGEGWTQAERDPVDVEYMALDYMACKYDKEPNWFHLEAVEWIRHQ